MIGTLIGLIVVGGLVAVIPMDARIKSVIVIGVIIVAAVLLLRFLGQV